MYLSRDIREMYTILSCFVASFWLLYTSCLVSSYVHPFVTKHPQLRLIHINHFSVTSDDEESSSISDTNNDENAKISDGVDDSDVSLEGYKKVRKKRRSTKGTN
mmetsp:Transcript_2123/g.5088  ORF Transcript_2123/g.5088 Transcript_2123/m.5088 type:complete len:104 (+) Transcript_2123:4-315(+)